VKNPAHIIKAFILVFLLQASAVMAQNAPVTTIATIGNANPGNISVPITVTGFNNIGAISLTIDYDHSVMNFTSGTPHPQLPSFPTGEIDLGSGFRRITMGWFGPGTTLADCSTIMTLHFTFIEGITELAFYDIGPSCEYADANFNVLSDTPQEDFYINGFVCGPVGNPGPISGDTVVCGGQTGVVFSVDPIENATAYTWDLQDGAIIVNGENTNAITVDFNDFAVSGDISVFGSNACGAGPLSFQTVIVNGRPIADAGNDTTINYGTSTTLHAAGGEFEVYAYHWSPEELLVDPDVQNPETVIMTQTTIFTVQVTNQMTFCTNSDEVLVTITGGPLSINPLAHPSQNCLGNTTQLYSNAGGGSGSYTYQWTCIPAGNPAWSSTAANPTVSPETSTLYFLSVDDGFTQVNDSVALQIFELPSAMLSGGDTLCGENVYTTLQVDLTGIPPWNFNYSFGNTTVFVSDVFETPYYIITSDPGNYMITYLEDINCSGSASGVAIVRRFPIPLKPEITVYQYELISSACCGNQWYRNGALIPGETGQTYSVTQSGDYFTIVTINGCSSEASDTVDMIVGLNEINTGTLNLYPNPAGDHVIVSLPVSSTGDFKVTIYNATGKVVSESTGNYSSRFKIDTSPFAKGLYFIVLRDENLVLTGKLLKQ